jgi:hypothetical protein
MKLEASEPLPSLSGYKTDSGTTFTRKEWKHRVVNPELVPREYLVPDDTKLRAAVRAGVREIAGVEVYEDESLPVRGRA